jgi:hypothetical protein
MMRLGRGVLAVAALVGLLWPLVLAPSGGDSSAAPDPARIGSLRVDMSVDRAGTLHATEVVTTQMPPGRHGIFRYWDVADAGDPHARAVPQAITITQDGAPATVDLSWQDQQRYRVARIGDPAVTLAEGRHTYRISYRVDGVLEAGAHGGSRFYWDVVPAGWQMAVGHAEVTLHLPAGTGGGATRCAVGVGATGGCRVVGADGSYRVRLDRLAPHTPVTVAVPVAVPPPGRALLPWPERFDPVLSRHLWLAVLLAVLTVAGLFLGLALGWRSHEKAPGLPLQYAPPEGVGPVQAAYVVTEQVPAAALQASLFQMAAQGLTELERTEAGWVVRGKATGKEWYADTDEVTRAVGKSLGVIDQYGTFAADGSVSRGERLVEAKSLLRSATTRWATSKRLLRPAVGERTGRVLVYLAMVLAVLGFALNPFDVTAMGAPFAAFALGGFALVLPGAGTRRTAKGRELWSRAGGFRRILSTPSAEERFDFSGREDLYTAYIPWAVAFGCAEEWQRKYETETGRPAPAPVWLVGPHYYGGVGSVADAIGSFESSLTSSISAYQATQRSSSGGGGGGFSGGGGGGGGGGGSW